jgi:hypothetical protein
MTGWRVTMVVITTGGAGSDVLKLGSSDGVIDMGRL